MTTQDIDERPYTGLEFSIPGRLEPRAIQEFKQIWKEQYQEELSDAEAELRARELLTFFVAISSVTSKEEGCTSQECYQQESSFPEARNNTVAQVRSGGRRKRGGRRRHGRQASESGQQMLGF